MDALVTAGGIPKPDEPLYSYTQGMPKATLDLNGKPMLQWVLDALSQSRKVQRVTVIGVEQEPGWTCDKPLTFVPNHGGLLDNVREGVHKVVEMNPQADLVLIVSADIPGITGEMVDWVIVEAEKTTHDLYYSVVKREVMEAVFPGSNRSYVHLKEGDFCGGDINTVRASLVTQNPQFWDRIIEARKSALRQASFLGFDILFLLLIRQLSLKRGVPKISRRLGLRGRAVISPYAEIAMDVDKPYQLEIMRQYLAQRNGKR